MNQAKVEVEFPKWGHVFFLLLKALRRSFISLIIPSVLPADVSNEVQESIKQVEGVHREHASNLAILLYIGPYILPYFILSIYGIIFDAAVFPFLFYLPLYHSWTEQILLEFRRSREASTRLHVVFKSMAFGFVFLLISVFLFGLALPQIFGAPLLLRATLYFSVFAVVAFSILLYEVSALAFGDTPLICVRDCLISALKSTTFGTLLNLVWTIPLSLFPSFSLTIIPPGISIISLLYSGLSGIVGFIVLVLLVITIFMGYSMMLTRYIVKEISRAKILLSRKIDPQLGV